MLLMATVFVACLVGAGLFAAVWVALFDQGERRLRRRVERLHGRRAGAAQSSRSDRSRASGAIAATARLPASIG